MEYVLIHGKDVKSEIHKETDMTSSGKRGGMSAMYS